MYIHLLNDSKQGIGGGWSFLSNLQKAIVRHTDHKIAGRIEDADICFVAGPTMVTRQTIDRVQELGKKLVVRLDNVPRNSRNRNTGTSRLIEFANRADGVIWQCYWARNYYGELITNKKQEVLYNSVDEEIFNEVGAKLERGEPGLNYLYSRFNRDETKNWEVAWYDFQKIYKENKDAKLYLVGQFSPEQVQYNFDFFRGEKFEYLGVIDNPNEMARVMRGCDYLFASYYNDCFSNTYLEALMCGVDLTNINMSGGTPEMLAAWEDFGRDYFKLERMAKEYSEFFEAL